MGHGARRLGRFAAQALAADDDGPFLDARLRHAGVHGGRLNRSPVGRAYLRVLERGGEVEPPRSAAELALAARARFGSDVSGARTGSIAWLRAGLPRG